MMKKIITMLAGVALIATACQNEKQPDGSEKIYTITYSVGGVDMGGGNGQSSVLSDLFGINQDNDAVTRVQWEVDPNIANYKGRFVWSPNEQVWVNIAAEGYSDIMMDFLINNSGKTMGMPFLLSNPNAVSTNTVPAYQTTFTGYITEKELEVLNNTAELEVMALYPRPAQFSYEYYCYTQQERGYTLINNSKQSGKWAIQRDEQTNDIIGERQVNLLFPFGHTISIKTNDTYHNIPLVGSGSVANGTIASMQFGNYFMSYLYISLTSNSLGAPVKSFTVQSAAGIPMSGDYFGHYTVPNPTPNELPLKLSYVGWKGNVSDMITVNVDGDLTSSDDFVLFPFVSDIVTFGSSVLEYGELRDTDLIFTFYTGADATGNSIAKTFTVPDTQIKKNCIFKIAFAL